MYLFYSHPTRGRHCFIIAYTFLFLVWESLWFFHPQNMYHGGNLCKTFVVKRHTHTAHTHWTRTHSSQRQYRRPRSWKKEIFCGVLEANWLPAYAPEIVLAIFATSCTRLYSIKRHLNCSASGTVLLLKCPNSTNPQILDNNWILACNRYPDYFPLYYNFQLARRTSLSVWLPIMAACASSVGAGGGWNGAANQIVSAKTLQRVARWKMLDDSKIE